MINSRLFSLISSMPKTPTYPSGLVAYYRADSSPNDQTGNGNNADPINSVTYVTGKKNNCFNLDGVSAYLNLGARSAFSFGTGNFSFGAWVNFNSLSGYQCIANFGDYYNYDNSISIYSYNDTVMLYYRETGGSFTNLGSTSSVFSTNTWYYINIVRSSGDVFCYINGTKYTLSTVLPVNKPVGNASYQSFLGRNSSGFYLNGKIDEIGIWNKSLSDSEVTTLYNGGAGLQY